jgi:hypothetical protein
MRDGPRKRAPIMLRQPFVPIKTKRVWFNETGAGVVHTRLGRGVRPRYGRGRAGAGLAQTAGVRPVRKSAGGDDGEWGGAGAGPKKKPQ